MRLEEIVYKTNKWMERHWQKVLVALCCVILLQQCTINSLQRKIVMMTEQGAAAMSDSVEVKSDSVCVASEGISLNCDDELPTHDLHSNWPLVVALLVVAALVGVVWHMRRNCIYPVGMFVSGSLRQNDTTGDLIFQLTVRNWSSKTLDVSDPVINFIIRGGTRRFRASLHDLPVTLQPGTSYKATIPLTGLVTRNIELQQTKAISLTVTCNEKRYSTLPKLIWMKQA